VPKNTSWGAIIPAIAADVLHIPIAVERVSVENVSAVKHLAADQPPQTKNLVIRAKYVTQAELYGIPILSSIKIIPASARVESAKYPNSAILRPNLQHSKLKPAYKQIQAKLNHKSDIDVHTIY